MVIDDILKQLKDLNITGISTDSRTIEAGDLFVCLNGDKFKGTDFVIDATVKGAKAILTDETVIAATVPVIKVKDIKKIFPILLAKFYDYPWREMQMIGVTGTDGKTTTATMIEYLLNQKSRCCYIGTNGIRYNNYNLKNKYTTLPPCEFTKLLRKVADERIKYVSMEASSQGLVNGRLDNVEFDVAIFTNLTHEHLDTHKTMENYFKAKLELFKKLDEKGLAIVNIDVPYGKRFKHTNLITYGFSKKADYRMINIQTMNKYTHFDLVTPNCIYNGLKTNVLEKYNLYNLLAAIICARFYKIDMKTIEKAIKELPKIEGRLELLTTTESFNVYIDFAHTPNALEKLLTHLKTKTKGRLITVHGSAGEKDKSKRPKMGVVSTSLSDFVIYTSEDPRNENPLDIINDLTKEVISNNYTIIEDRTTAIKYAIDIAQANDTVVITGKGNDQYYESDGQTHTYSDMQEVIKVLEEKKLH